MSRPRESEPLVSVIIPTFFRNDHLHRCLASVEAQSYRNIETFVVDDSGEEHAAPVVDRHDARYIGFRENRGQNVARSKGFEAATGEYIQFLDDDDQLHPEKIEKQVRYLEREPEVGVVYCGRQLHSGHLELPRPNLSGEVLSEMLTFDNQPCLTSTLLIDVNPLQEIHPFPPYAAAADVPIKIELAERVEFGYVDEVLVHAGEPDSPMGQSWAHIDCKWQILEDYRALYDGQPPWVRKKAVASIYQMTGRRYVESSLWSPSAIVNYGRSLWHHPYPDLRDVGESLVSLGGRPTFRLAAFVYRAVSRARQGPTPVVTDTWST